MSLHVGRRSLSFVREQTANKLTEVAYLLLPLSIKSTAELEQLFDPVLYNLRGRRINRGPPGKPLSSRSAKRLQCQQISSTQLVPNRAGWHRHTHIHTCKRTRSNTNDTVIQRGSIPACPAEGLADGNAVAVKGSGRGLQISINIWDWQFIVATVAKHSCMCLSVVVCAGFFLLWTSY